MVEIVAVDPGEVCCGDQPVQVRVLGAGFTRDSVVVLGGRDQPTEYGDGAEVRFDLDPTRIDHPTELSVLVRNPDNEVSNTLRLSVLPKGTPQRTPREARGKT